MTMHDRLPIIVGHQDTLLRLYLSEQDGGRSFFVRSEQGHLDLPRAQEGGLAGSFFAIFAPEPPCEDCDTQNRQMVVVQTDNGYEIPYAAAIDPDYARRVTIAMMARLFRLEAESDGQLKVARTVEDLEY